MAIGEARRKFLQGKFEEMFPEIAKEVEKYGEFRKDNGSICIYRKDNKAILAFSYVSKGIWRLETYKCYCEEKKK